jgi:regulator of replication initiation timing
MEAKIRELEAKAGLSAKGEPMPKTIGEWQYIAELHAKGLEIANRENNVLRIENNKLKQKLDRLSK